MPCVLSSLKTKRQTDKTRRKLENKWEFQQEARTFFIVLRCGMLAFAWLASLSAACFIYFRPFLFYRVYFEVFLSRGTDTAFNFKVNSKFNQNRETKGLRPIYFFFSLLSPEWKGESKCRNRCSQKGIISVFMNMT